MFGDRASIVLSVGWIALGIAGWMRYRTLRGGRATGPLTTADAMRLRYLPLLSVLAVLLGVASAFNFLMNRLT